MHKQSKNWSGVQYPLIKVENYLIIKLENVAPDQTSAAATGSYSAWISLKKLKNFLETALNK